jgi:aryl-alcohol dehydrogenase-like predicted oxidoreductase
MSFSKELPTRPLGKNGPLLPRLGLGLMSNSGNYGLPASDEVRFTFLDEAHKLGETFWDTGEHNSSLTL